MPTGKVDAGIILPPPWRSLHTAESLRSSLEDLVYQDLSRGVTVGLTVSAQLSIRMGCVQAAVLVDPTRMAKADLTCKELAELILEGTKSQIPLGTILEVEVRDYVE